MRKRVVQGIIMFVVTFFVIAAVHKEGKNYRDIVKNGDVIFQTSKSAQSVAIELATRSSITHCGIIFKKHNKIFVYEASSKVKLTPIDEWIKRGVKQSYVVMRLRDRVLTQKDITSMRTVGETFMGKEYDAHFRWSDDKIYCSELVRKIYSRALSIKLGTLEEINSFDLSSNEVLKIVEQRFKYGVNEDEPVITPASIYDSRYLEEVIKG